MVIEKKYFKNFISSLKRRLGENLISVVLFGSRARGDQKPESDWDLLIIAKNLPERFMQRYWFIKESLPTEWRGIVSIIAKTPQEFEANLASLYLDIALDGKVIYDKNNYAQNRLSDLKKLINKKGLRREKQDGDFVWCWENFPGQDWSISWDEVL